MNVTSPKDGNHSFSKKNRFNTNKPRFHKLNEQAQSINLPEDRDSIVSSNTTSIMTDDAFDYNEGIASRTKNINSDSDRSNDTIKQNNYNKRETGYNPFYNGSGINQRYTQFRKREFEPTLAENKAEEYISDEDNVKIDEDNIENELQFTPKIKEASILRSSLLGQRNVLNTRNPKSKESHIKVKPIINDKSSSQRKSSAALRKQLGKPLPLPYLNSPNSDSTPTLQRKEEVFTDEVLQKKRELIESKWHRLLFHDKKMVEKKLESLREYERKRMPPRGTDVSSSEQDNSFKISTPTKSYVSLEQKPLPNLSAMNNFNDVTDNKEKEETNNNILKFQAQRDPLQILQSEIEMHTKKLDTIIELLKDDTDSKEKRKVVTNDNAAPEQMVNKGWRKNVMMIYKKSGNIMKKYREYFLWTICILILLYCNIYVYYRF